MNIQNWYAIRGSKFLAQRASKIFGRYGISATRSKNRIEESMRTLASFGSAPTFFTPGKVVERYPKFIQRLQAEGAEIAVHSYQHIDLRAIKLSDAIEQLKKAAQVFEKWGIENYGFRSPYLSCSDELINAIPEDMFDYSSNLAIWVDGPSLKSTTKQNLIFDTLDRFYQPTPSSQAISLPFLRNKLLEIPVCVPDDLQLHDGLSLDSDGISNVWIDMLHQTFSRSELFNLIFHPELSSIFKESFENLLHEAKLLKPQVWITSLHDISEWWKEKSGFRVEFDNNSNELSVQFSCTSRATILAKGLDPIFSDEVWDGVYTQLRSKSLTLPKNHLPFIGLPEDTSSQLIYFLRDQGYIIVTGDLATSCGIYMDADALSKLNSQVDIINYIETFSAPLVRYSRWPNGAKSALCFTGDLDALTLFDYASRLSS